MIDQSPIPDAGWITVRDGDVDRFLAAWQSELPEQTTVPLQGLLYECEVCGRLFWQREGATEYRVYRSEPPAS
jgi:hypothetical protein